MSNFNYFEKKLSQIIKINPFIHSKIKLLYQKITYQLNKNKDFIFKLNSNCKLIDFKIENSFFGYYDHQPFSNDMKYFVCHQLKKNTKIKSTIKTHHDSFNKINLNLYKFENNKIKFLKTLCESKFFNFQQGIRPIWINNDELIFNSIKNNTLVATKYNLKTNSFINYDFPVQEILIEDNVEEKLLEDVKGPMLLSIDYKKLDYINKDYGYGLNKESIHQKLYTHHGIIGHDLNSNTEKFHLDIKRIHQLSKNKDIPIEDCEINHLHQFRKKELGSRVLCTKNSFAFIYRSKSYNGFSELFYYVVGIDKLKRLYSGNLISHYCFINIDTFFAYLEHDNKNGFYEIECLKDRIFIRKQILKKKDDNSGDGHPSISPNRKWIVYDNYPNKSREIHLFITETKLSDQNYNRKILLGKFLSPIKFNGYNRCDLHPRWSPDGKYISIDSTHEGYRKTYLIDISKITNKYE